jgi:hypothetical protein
MTRSLHVLIVTLTLSFSTLGCGSRSPIENADEPGPVASAESGLIWLEATGDTAMGIYSIHDGAPLPAVNGDGHSPPVEIPAARQRFFTHLEQTKERLLSEMGIGLAEAFTINGNQRPTILASDAGEYVLYTGEEREQDAQATTWHRAVLTGLAEKLRTETCKYSGHASLQLAWSKGTWVFGTNPFCNTYRYLWRAYASVIGESHKLDGGFRIPSLDYIPPNKLKEETDPMGSATSYLYRVDDYLGIHQVFQLARQTMEWHEPDLELLYHARREEHTGFDLIDSVAPGGSLHALELVVDRDRTPHLLYQKLGPLDQGFTHVYATRTQSGWKRVEIRIPMVPGTTSRLAIGSLALEVDEDGAPHVVCQIQEAGADGAHLYYGKVQGDEVVFQPPLDEGISGDVAIAAGQSVLFVAYFKNHKFVLKTLPR